MTPGKSIEMSGNKPAHLSTTKRSVASQRTTTGEDMDSSRPIATDFAMSSTPEPATAAMIDVSSWAQRGLVLENKDLRRTLEMTKSAHTAQLAQIAKRNKMDKEELEVKLEAEMYRLAAQQRTLDELAARLEAVQEDNGKLTQSVQAFEKQILTETEEKSKLQREVKDSKSALKSTNEELDNIKEKQEELLARESRVAAVLNEQHHKIMNLSQAYHEQENDKVQLQTLLETAEKEVARLKSRMSSILNTLVNVVRDNGDDRESETKLTDRDGEAPHDVFTGSHNSKKLEGRKRARGSDQRASDLSASVSQLGGVNAFPEAVVREDQDSKATPIPVTPRNISISTSTANTSSDGAGPRLDASVDNRRTVVRAKRRRIVSDPESGENQRHSQPIQVKQEPARSDIRMLDTSAFKAAAQDDGTLGIEESVMVTAVEVSIPATIQPGMESLPEGGEDSPERAAVESAIGTQDGESTSNGILEEPEIGSAKKPVTTYAKKRKNGDPNQLMDRRAETPTLHALACNVVAESGKASVVTTPLSDSTKATASKTSAYATRAKSGNSSKTGSAAVQSIASSGSPSSRKRQHDKHSHGEGEGMISPGMARVKEEMIDAPYDGRPRITGGDDEEDPLCI